MLSSALNLKENRLHQKEGFMRVFNLLLTLFQPWYFDLVFVLGEVKLLKRSYFISDGGMPSTWNLAQVLCTLNSFKNLLLRIYMIFAILNDVSIFNKNIAVFVFSLYYIVFFVFFILSRVTTNCNKYLFIVDGRWGK